VTAATSSPAEREQDERLADLVQREETRRRRFFRRRVPDPWDAEDILQDACSRLVEANRLLMPIDHVTGWLFQVARNRITDLFRKKTPARFDDVAVSREGEEDGPAFDQLLASRDAGPDAL
jgi:RNA polymerase sigma factor (sigma-70 family)